ncbi:MAG: hypothetical protein JXR94_02535 [Candidatus Hydrogenedentes bacterium]|nr:hypothetical protein [Candidatus Hydrogenedentota bacterium]
MFGTKGRCILILCAVLLAIVVVAALPLETAVAEWETRGEPPPAVGDDAECYDQALPAFGMWATWAHINPCHPENDKLTVLPGEMFHFDATGGGDCDIGEVVEEECGACGSDTCAASHTNRFDYSWHVTGPLEKVREWGWRKEFVWIRVKTTAEEGEEATIYVEQPDDCSVYPGDGPLFFRTQWETYIEVGAPSTCYVSVARHIDTTFSKQAASSVLYKCTTEVLLADDDEGLVVNPNEQLPDYDVEKWLEDTRDNVCGKAFTLFCLGDELPTVGESGDGYAIIDTQAKFNAVWGMFDTHFLVVTDLQWNPGIAGIDAGLKGYTQAVGTLKMVVDCNADRQVWVHEWGHGKGLHHRQEAPPAYEMDDWISNFMWASPGERKTWILDGTDAGNPCQTECNQCGAL